MSILGDTAIDNFLATYWQQQPLLIRGAMADYQSPVSADELAGLSLENPVESRLVTHFDGKYALSQGPLDEKIFSTLPDQDWTLLVQAVDLWVPEVADLLDAFDFLPRWRVDDIMVSYATVGGSVGPHVDQYDVFLLQVDGAREWLVGDGNSDLPATIDEGGLKLLPAFDPVERWTLQAGDMLYLPPGVPHWGISQDNDCITYSIGFRAPMLGEMLTDLAFEIIAQDNDQPYRDPPLNPLMVGREINPAFIGQVQSMLTRLAADEALLTDWFARYMTTPKYPECVEDSNEVRIAKTAQHVYKNGEIDD